MGASAPEIITYIGVPLAVLGVTPIFWLAYRVIAEKLILSRDIEKNHLMDISTRADLLSGVVEVTLMQYQLETLDRAEDNYWTYNLDRSPLEGGSWTILQWRKPYQRIGRTTRRLQYSDPLRLPRAKIDFESLVVFLLDKGASLRPRGPNRQHVLGFTLLLNNGIRTSAGTRLLFGKDDEPLLEIAASFDDEFERLPTLAINRKGIQEGQDNRLLYPPGWLLLRSLTVIKKKSIEKAKIEGVKPLSTEINKKEELSVTNTQTSKNKSAQSHSESSTEEEKKNINTHSTSTADNQDRDSGAKSSTGAQKDPSIQEGLMHVDGVNIGHISENTSNQLVPSKNTVASQETDRSYQVFLSATSLSFIKCQVMLQEPIPMQIPEHLNDWFYAATKAYNVQNRTICKYTIPTHILNVITSRELLTSWTAVENLLSVELRSKRHGDLQDLNPIMAHLLEGWIEIDVKTEDIFESIFKAFKRSSLFRSDLITLYKHKPGVPLACAATLSWYRLIEIDVVSSHLTSVETTEGLLNDMIDDKEQAEYFIYIMDSLARGDLGINYIKSIAPQGRKGRTTRYQERKTRFAKATWLLCSMAKYLPRDDDFCDVNACFVSYPTVLLG